MPQEIELKLHIHPKDKPLLLAHPLLQQTPQSRHLVSEYFDTPDLQLRQQGIALRLRQIGSEYWQTIKTKETVERGLSKRQEYEIKLISSHFNFDSLPDTLQAILLPLEDQLQKIFVTEFQRLSWDVLWAEKTLIEVALDEGEIICGKWREPIFELELEIKQGDSIGLIAFAQQLKQTIDLKPFDSSKAKRGYRLFQLKTS